MFFRCLLLVLVCLQDFTVAQYADVPGRCCYSYQTHRIPVRLIIDYQETGRQCPKPGVIFTLKSRREVCADPNDQWVKDHMKILDQHLYDGMIQPESSV